jgi:hypothetical protein
MSKYIKYNECQVKINDENIFALRASLSADSPSESQMTYGGKIESYKANSYLGSKVSFEYYATGEIDNIYNLTGDISCSGEFGGISFSGAYLTDYSVNISPYLPVSFSADFVIFSGYKNELSTGAFTSNSLELANGAHSDISNFNYNNIGLDNPTSISYSVSCERVPNHEIGNEFSSNVRLGSVVKNLSIEGENIGSLINHSGQDIAGVSVQPKTLNNLSRGQLIECSGIIKSQSLSVEKNGFIKGSIEIEDKVR